MQLSSVPVRLLTALLILLLLCYILLQMLGTSLSTGMQPTDIIPSIRNASAMGRRNVSGVTAPALDSDIIVQEQKRRRGLISAVCSRNESGLAKGPRWPYHIIDDTHKVIYCYIPKVACSSWKQILVTLTGSKNKDPPVHQEAFMKGLGFRFMNHLSPKAIESLMTSYKSFMFTRHPFERIVSAYVEKFTKTTSFTKHFHQDYGCTIIRKFRTNFTANSLKKCDDVTFPEFVKYLIDLSNRHGYFNSHWRPFYKICNPCTAQYSYIGKLETLEYDRQYILESFFKAGNLTFPKKNSMHHGTTDAFLNKISQTERQALYDIYKLDFELFGYSLQSQLA